MYPHNNRSGFGEVYVFRDEYVRPDAHARGFVKGLRKVEAVEYIGLDAGHLSRGCLKPSIALGVVLWDCLRHVRVQGL